MPGSKVKKHGQDVGEQARREWVSKYAAQFRENWEKTHNNQGDI